MIKQAFTKEINKIGHIQRDNSKQHAFKKYVKYPINLKYIRIFYSNSQINFNEIIDYRHKKKDCLKSSLYIVSYFYYTFSTCM
ncbi:hypothetical protein HNP36_003877 [Chryseobacterium shigense]|uniref:Uncharacterized protein n=1 Tax=Chryseobacterium shigense TaxID=297244 RepID=A0A841NFW7_9FLAO|nr:hypothetical protein [Chryseobacterium shigense]